MKVSTDWLKELVDLNISVDAIIHQLPLRSVSIKEVTPNSIELDMKGYNRADLLSMRGVAQEVAAIIDSRVKFNDLAVRKLKTYKVKEARVKVFDNKFCPVYCIAKIENLKIEQSNDSWVKKLSDCGIRSINNVADVTNLVMLEYGQPMHAFDAKGVKDESITVRTAKDGERITTLDGKTRHLATSDLLIADSLNALGIAGVMGGKDSEISDSTTTILLEAAIFDPVSIRKTAQRHNLSSEASKRFQHGLTKTNLLHALQAAIKMYEGLGGKLTALTIVGNTKDEGRIVRLTQQKVNSLIGIDIPPQQIETSLQKLGFKLASHIVSGNTVWEVTVPYWRLDIEIEEDLIEEVARMYGYEKIPSKELKGELPKKINQTLPNFIYDLKRALAEAGLTEVQTYSFYSSKTINDLRLAIIDLVKIANPISSETEFMRDNLWPNLLEVVAKNLKNGFKEVAIFEVGKVYTPQKGDLPEENYRLAIALINGTDNPIQELNQIWQKAIKHLEEEKMKLQLQGEWGKENAKEYFHPTRTSFPLAEIHPRYVNKFGIEKRVAVLEIDLEPLI